MKRSWQKTQISFILKMAMQYKWNHTVCEKTENSNTTFRISVQLR